MAVYVDDMQAAFGRMIMCHMMADTRDELVAMADRIGVQRKWIQKADRWDEHFDIALTKRKLAVAAGAIEVTAQELVARMYLKRPVEARPLWVREHYPEGSK
jgi:hypothetical protein